MLTLEAQAIDITVLHLAQLPEILLLFNIKVVKLVMWPIESGIEPDI